MKKISLLMLIVFLVVSSVFAKSVTNVMEADDKVLENQEQQTSIILINGMGYFPLDTVARDYNAQVEMGVDLTNDGQEVTLKLEKGDVVLFDESKIVIVDGIERWMNKKFMKFEGEYIVPLELLLTKSFAKVSGYKTTWELEGNLLQIQKRDDQDDDEFAGLVKNSNRISDDIVILETSQGDIVINLLPVIAPKACENFMKLIENGYYNGMTFHKVMKDFLIQAGDPTGTGRGGKSVWEEPFEDEITETVQFDSPGLVAMANNGPDTNKSQFFITVDKTPWLNGKHTIFGKVVKGYDVVEKIENVKINASAKPIKDQKILKAYVKKN